MEKAISDSSCVRKRFFSGCQIASIVGLVLVGGCWVVGYISLGSPHPYFTTTPLSLADFNSRFPHADELQLPRSATNIFWAHSNRGFTGTMTLYRFDAPVSDCVAYGKRLLQQNDASHTTNLMPLTSSPAPIEREILEAMGLTKIDWFDVETIRSGFEGQACRLSPPGMFWIDTDRGRFYVYVTD